MRIHWSRYRSCLACLVNKWEGYFGIVQGALVVSESDPKSNEMVGWSTVRALCEETTETASELPRRLPAWPPTRKTALRGALREEVLGARAGAPAHLERHGERVSLRRSKCMRNVLKIASNI